MSGFEFLVETDQWGKDILGKVEELLPEELANLIVFAKETLGYKIFPAYSMIVLSKKSPEILKTVFNRILAEPEMMGLFVTGIKNNVAGRKSLGMAQRKLVCAWFRDQTKASVFNAFVCHKEGVKAAINMAHPKPCDLQSEAIFNYIVGNKKKLPNAPQYVREFDSLLAAVKDPELFKKVLSGELL